MSFKEWLDGELNERKWSRRQLAREGGISDTMLTLIYKGERSPGAKTIEAIARALDMPPELVFRKSLELPDIDMTAEQIKDAMDFLKSISPEARQTILDISRLQFGRENKSKGGNANDDDDNAKDNDNALRSQI